MSRTALAFWIGGWAGAVLAALITLAIDSSVQAEELSGGYRLRAGAILVICALAFVGGGIVGAIVGTPRGELETRR